MRAKRFLMLTAVTVMALAITTAVACGSDTQPAAQTTVTATDTLIAPKVAAQSTSPGETEQPASLGMPAQDSEDTSEIVVLDGAFDSDDEEDESTSRLIPVRGERRGETRLSDAEGGEGDSDTPTDEDVPSILPVKEVPEGIGPTSSGVLNPDSCEGVLGPAPESFELKTRSATDTASADNPAVAAMCLAYYTSDTSDSSLSVALIVMNSTEAALDHWDILQGSFADSGIEYVEERGPDRDLITATLDVDGMGTMIALRIGSNLVSIHNGPTSELSLWQEDLMIELAHSLLERL